MFLSNLFNAELSLKVYWWRLRLHSVVVGKAIPNATLLATRMILYYISSSVSHYIVGCKL